MTKLIFIILLLFSACTTVNIYNGKSDYSWDSQEPQQSFRHCEKIDEDCDLTKALSCLEICDD